MLGKDEKKKVKGEERKRKERKKEVEVGVGLNTKKIRGSAAMCDDSATLKAH
jgi:hypothetical protein